MNLTCRGQQLLRWIRLWLEVVCWSYCKLIYRSIDVVNCDVYMRNTGKRVDFVPGISVLCEYAHKISVTGNRSNFFQYEKWVFLKRKKKTKNDLCGFLGEHKEDWRGLESDVTNTNSPNNNGNRNKMHAKVAICKETFLELPSSTKPSCISQVRQETQWRVDLWDVCFSRLFSLSTDTDFSCSRWKNGLIHFVCAPWLY